MGIQDEGQINILYMYIILVFGKKCINSVAIPYINGGTSQKLTGEEETTFCNIITPPHYCTSQELYLFTFDSKGKWLLGNVDIKLCMHSLGGVQH